MVQGNTVVNNGYGNSHTIRNMPDRISGIRIQQVTSGTIHQNYVGTDASKSDAVTQQNEDFSIGG